MVGRREPVWGEGEVRGRWPGHSDGDGVRAKCVRGRPREYSEGLVSVRPPSCSQGNAAVAASVALAAFAAAVVVLLEATRDTGYTAASGEGRGQVGEGGHPSWKEPRGAGVCVWSVAFCCSRKVLYLLLLSFPKK